MFPCLQINPAEPCEDELEENRSAAEEEDDQVPAFEPMLNDDCRLTKTCTSQSTIDGSCREGLWIVNVLRCFVSS